MMFAFINIEWIFSTIFILLYSITIIGLSLVIITENRNPLKTIPWVIVLLLAPGIGLVFYFFFGQDNRKQKIISRRTYKRIINQPKTGKLPTDSCHLPKEYSQLSALISRNNKSPLLYGSKIDIFTNGKDKFAALIDDLNNAKQYIHLQYYIFCDDSIGNKIKDILIRKAQEGVKVRVLYDDVGCWNVHNNFFNEMKSKGVEIYPFLKVVFPVFTSKVNYRNHRKIVVIDGYIGYIGGMNIADRYTDGAKWGIWRDTHFRIIGKGVHGLQASFLVDWYAMSKQILSDKIFYPKTEVYDDNIMQVITSGPIGPWRNLLQGIIHIITNAKKYIYIQTPYFLPTESLSQALHIAALSGVDVRLMLPLKSDTRTVHMASCSFIEEMLRAGAKVYFYKPGFLHSKLVICDDYISCIGSANMDFRSFEHNFEVNAIVYQTSFAREMKKIFLHDQENCEKIKLSVWIKRPRMKKMQESFMRLFSPLL